MRQAKKAGRAALIVFAAFAFALFGLALSRAQSGSIQFYGPLSRVITPNGDGINDRVFFCFENPSDSGISGKIYTLLGTEVASIGARTDRTGVAGVACPASVIRAQFATWDGTADNVRVRSGLYVYRITSEDQVFSGTLLVVR
ncbi:MAG: hypothetical protein HY923_04865 [Elusimicrobia bacterium]|nr:hypothetical protein [Elusimicrobiota bacterium]